MASTTCVAGIDLGGTKLRIALVTPRGRIAAAGTWPTDTHGGPDAVVAQMAAGVRDMRQRAGIVAEDLKAAGAGAPGPLNIRTGVTSTLPNLPGWEDYPLRERLSAALACPVALGNDANVAALGEHRFGAGRGVKHMAMVTLGTGVGGGVVVDGRMLEGTLGAAGEIGHVVVQVGGRPCGCGRRGCLEAYAGGHGLERSAAALLASDPRGPSSELGRQSVAAGGPTTRILGLAARAGDPLALQVFDEATTHLAAGLVTLVHLFNPELVLIGGGLTALRDLYVDPACELARTLVFPLHARGLRFGYAALGENMGALGAAALALDMIG